MSARINIENYEAFYLDYLEGTLDHELCCELEIFLDNHPELQVDEALPVLNQSLESLDLSDLQQLMVHDEHAQVTHSSVEQFCIAELEGINSPEKSRELRDFITAHPNYRKEYELYQKVKLKPDFSLVFSDKNQLKKAGFVIPMWIKASLSAAAVVAVTWFVIPTTEVKYSPNQLSLELLTKASPIADYPTSSKTTQTHSKETNQSDREGMLMNHSVENLLVSHSSETAIQRNETAIAKIPTRKLELFPSSNSMQDFSSETVAFTHIPNKSKKSFGELINPIPVLTGLLVNNLKQDVEVLVDKEDRKKRFYIKIGRFQISKNVPSNEELASN